jgi:hypothetical protein
MYPPFALSAITFAQQRRNHMRIKAAAALLAILLAGCSKPQDIIFGPEPLKQVAEQGDQFKKLSEEDRTLLVAYLNLAQLAKPVGGEVKSPTGRTVGEVLVDARTWQEKVKATAAEAKKREAEAADLRAKVINERKAVAEKIASSVVVAVVGTRVLPENYDVGRYSEMLSVSYAIENKSDKGIRQLKGRVIFKDATGDTVGWLPIDFDEPVAAGKTLKTTTGRGWKLNKFRNGDIEKIAGREFSTMTASFEPESIAFADGEVLKAPELRD